jgi:hypothetical protein
MFSFCSTGSLGMCNARNMRRYRGGVGDAARLLHGRFGPRRAAIHKSGTHRRGAAFSTGSQLRRPDQKRSARPPCAICVWPGYWSIKEASRPRKGPRKAPTRTDTWPLSHEQADKKPRKARESQNGPNDQQGGSTPSYFGQKAIVGPSRFLTHRPALLLSLSPEKGSGVRS